MKKIIFTALIGLAIISCKNEKKEEKQVDERTEVSNING